MTWGKNYINCIGEAIIHQTEALDTVHKSSDHSAQRGDERGGAVA